MQLCACACCGELAKFSATHNVAITAEWQIALRKKLRFMDHIPQKLRDHYDLNKLMGSRFNELANIPLERRGVVNTSGRRIVLRFCGECYKSLRKRNTTNPPWKAIANGFTIGRLPSKFLSLSHAEHRMATISPLSFSLLSVYGRYGGTLTSHMVARMSKNGCAISKVPRELSTSDIMVVFANAAASDKEIARRKWYRIRQQKVSQLLHFYVNNSIAYTEDDIDVNAFTHLPEDGDAPHILDDNDDTNTEILSQALKESDRVGSARNSLIPKNLTDSFIGVTERHEMPRYKKFSDSNSDINSLRRFIVSDSSIYSRETNELFYGQTFPYLFPYAYGTPNDERYVKVSTERCYRHYLMLADRTLAQDKILVLFMYDILAQRKLHLNVHLQIKMNPSAMYKALTITSDDLKNLIKQTANYQAALRRGFTIPQNTAEFQSDAQSIMRLVQNAAFKTYGTNEERVAMKRQLDAFCDCFGRPHVMSTHTPNDADSSYIAFHAEKLDSSITFDDLFYWKSTKFPSISDVRTATSFDPALAALNFNQLMMEEIIPSHFGWDLNTNKPIIGNGIYKYRTKAFVSCFEEQGAATGKCHAHSLLWFEDWPATLEDELSLGKDLHLQIERFADENKITVYPVLELFTLDDGFTLQSPCCIRGFITETKIPFIAKTNAATHPPVVGICTSCQKRYTSMQLRDKCSHLILSICNFTDEVSWKNSTLLDVRKIISSLEDFPIPEPLPLHLSLQQKQRYRSLILTFIQLHSSGLDIQLAMNDVTDEEKNYLSTTVQLSVALEETHEHSPTHHGSCFKNSPRGKKNNVCVCRYNIPKDPQKSTKSTDNDLLTRRLVGCEYMNGYNPKIFAKMKSNGDTAIIKGQNVHYITNYPAKFQKDIYAVELNNKLEECFKRSISNRLRIETDDPCRTDEQNGCGRIHSLGSSYTNAFQQVLLQFFVLLL